MQAFRAEQGGRIDRGHALHFRFDGVDYVGYRGDTLASALLANGISIVSRSFKLHRPRGIVGAGAEEPNAIVTVGRGAAVLPNQRATQVTLYEGLEARTVKGWPSVSFDIAAINDVFSSFFAAGFYYKTFMRPRSLWPWFERLIRRSAGLGEAPREQDPDRYEHCNVHCDVLVAGAGPAGLTAALAAARSGATVILADEQSELGGRLLSETALVDGQAAMDWVAEVERELESLDNVTILPRATVFGYFDHNFLAVAERCHEAPANGASAALRERLWRVRAEQVVLAQGAIERPLVFCNNDRPGVMLASAASTYVRRYGVRPGNEAVVFTNNDSAYQAAIDLSEAGVAVAAIIDSRKDGALALHAAVEKLSIPVMRGHVVSDVVGRRRVRAVKIARWQGDASQLALDTIRIDCDLLLMSGGWSPAVHLHSQSGGKNAWDETLHAFVPVESPQDCRSAGAAAGLWSLDECLRSGHEAGGDAAASCGFTATEHEAPGSHTEASNDLEPLWRVPAASDPDRCPKQFVDFQNDTSIADIRLAVREGFRNIEHVKRYTALGFGTDQGKLGNINGMAALAECLNEPIQNVGTTTFRPAYTPVSFGVCAGEGVGGLYDPERKTAIHEWHEDLAAPMENVGQWLRPWYFPEGDEDIDQAVARECLAVRNAVGIMDASTLGKIIVDGPDAVTFLDRIYTHNVAGMKQGRCAYGIMLGEDGMVMDDGVMARLGDEKFYLTTTTGGAAHVLSWLELWLQTEWPELTVYLTSVTDHFATVAVAGPNSRKVLQAAGCDIDLEKDEFPFMSVKSAELAGVPVQLFRVSFSGELAFEVNVDSRFALGVWRALMAAGKEYGITPYGTETMHVLRAEKGFVILGQDTDGSVSPIDLGLNWLLAKDKDFLGRRSLARQDMLREDRKQLVGLRSGSDVLKEGAQLVADPLASKPVPMLGHVTSAYNSAALGYPIALALLAGGRQRHGETLYAVASDDSAVPVEVVAPVFYDSKGARQHV